MQPDIQTYKYLTFTLALITTWGTEDFNETKYRIRSKNLSPFVHQKIPRSHIVANGKLYCFLLDMTNIRIKWRKLERQEIRQD